jgi:hypothetical protein
VSSPLLTVLSFSGGTGSGALIEMVLHGHIERPDPFLVINADPGMENSATYTYVADVESRCAAADIPFIRVKRDLYAELVMLKAGNRTRFDTPPFWTRNRQTGKRGRLKQQCTGAYKIAPMNRAMRLWMQEYLGISAKSCRLGTDTICKWIGFSHDEWMRIKEPPQQYIYMAYPLIDLRMTKADIADYYRQVINRPLPPRSVCNACFANDIATFKEMYLHRPYDWAQAVLIDELIRDLSCVGVDDECFVSSTLVPLQELADLNFGLGPAIMEQDAEMCHSGHCFV